jgi:hypothetical protein
MTAAPPLDQRNLSASPGPGTARRAGFSPACFSCAAQHPLCCHRKQERKCACSFLEISVHVRCHIMPQAAGRFNRCSLSCETAAADSWKSPWLSPGTHSGHHTAGNNNRRQVAGFLCKGYKIRACLILIRHASPGSTPANFSSFLLNDPNDLMPDGTGNFTLGRINGINDRGQLACQ